MGGALLFEWNIRVDGSLKFGKSDVDTTIFPKKRRVAPYIPTTPDTPIPISDQTKSPDVVTILMMNVCYMTYTLSVCLTSTIYLDT